MPPKKAKKEEAPPVAPEEPVEVIDLDEAPLPPERTSHEIESGRDRYYSLEDVLQYCFPTNVLHARSTARLLLLGRYGNSMVNLGPKCPACKVNCPDVYKRGECTWHLTGGYKNMHIVTQQELLSMIYQVEREDIISIYSDSVALTPDQESFILSQAESGGKQLKKELKHAIGHNFTKDEMSDLLDDVPKDEIGNMRFLDMQKIIFEEHAGRVKEAKKVFPDLVQKKMKSKKKTVKQETQTFYTEEELDLRTRGMAAVNEINPQRMTKLLHNNVFRISHVEQANEPGLVQNAIMMRKLKTETGDRRTVSLSDEIDEHRDIRLQIISKIWDSNSCVRGQNKGSHVKQYHSAPGIRGISDKP